MNTLHPSTWQMPHTMADAIGRARAWWFGLPPAVRTPAWVITMSLLVCLLLLVAFHQVVSQSVRQGELLRVQVTSHAEAVWRCNALHGERVRKACLAQLNAPAPAEESAETRSDTQVAQSSGR